MKKWNEWNEMLPKEISLVDRISKLPDSVLCHIVSFLKTKEAVVTSVLSRRWEFLWTYVDVLVFENHFRHFSDKVPAKMQFSQFVNRVLQLHRAPLIKKMSLHCYKIGCNEFDVVTWIQTAVSYDLERLHLRCNFKFKWPLCLFYSRTLIELSLASAKISEINVPAAPFFPNLKKLCLDLPVYKTHSLNRFISGCSVLEHFLIKFEFDFAEACYISSATLKTIFLECILYAGLPLLILDTPALECLKIKGMGNSLILVESSVPPLLEAHISFLLHGYNYDSASDSALSYLEGLCNVAVLCLDIGEFVMPVTSGLHAHFHNLTRLEIIYERSGLDILRHFMERSNNLQVITIKKWAHKAAIYEEESGVIWDEPQHIPKCLLSSLRIMCIQGYEDKNDEGFDLLTMYVLANAKVLKSMRIHKLNSVKNDEEFKLYMLQKIATFPRASEVCEFSFF